MALTESVQMYLETILILTKNNTKVRAIDIVEHMGFSKPSVSRALKNLKNAGYVSVADDSAVTLTELGRKEALKTYEMHKVLSTLLISLGVSEKTAIDDACKLEHVISDESFKKIKEHLKKYSFGDEI